MNIVMEHKDRGEYYVASVRKSNDEYCTVGRKILATGRVYSVYEAYRGSSLVEAKRQAKRLAKTKVKMKGYAILPTEDAPCSVANNLEVSEDMQMSEAEMLEFVGRMKSEKYVIFKDTFGIEARFDIGVEYLAYETDDPTMLSVLDIHGESCQCLYYRFDTIKPTEEATKLLEMK